MSTVKRRWQPFIYPAAQQEDEVEAEAVIKDANGNTLSADDSATLVKDLKLKGGSGTLKAGTKIKNIRSIARSTV